MDHLLNDKTKHWDIQIRQLTASSLSALVPFNPSYFVSQVVPSLLTKSFDKHSMNARHGAVYALAEILVAFSG